MTTRQRRMLLLFVTAIVYALVLFPGAGEGNHSRPPWRVGVGISGPEDVAYNALLFVPFGIAGALALGGAHSLARLAGLIAASAAVLSLSIEMLQTLIPSRFPSLVDVAANTAGASIGVAAYVLWKARRPAALIMLYLVFACAFSLLLERSARLSGWNETFPLLIGNEANGHRLWSGKLWRVEIADRAASSTEVRDLLKSTEQGLPHAFGNITGASVASYDLASPDPCSDKGGLLPPLVREHATACVATGTAAAIGHQGWFRTAGPAGPLTRRISRSGQFTVVASLEAANNWQSGPARIVSLSANADRRNLTLGQRGADFIVRIRTPLSGLNGNNVELVAPRAIQPGRRQTVAVTYDGSRLAIFVDHARPSASIVLGPGLALAKLAAPSEWLGAIAHGGRAEQLYFAGIFAGLGILTALLPMTTPRGPIARGWLIAVWSSPLIFELIIQGVTGRRLDLARPAAGVVALSVSAWGVRSLAGRIRTPAQAWQVPRQWLSMRTPAGNQVRRFAKIGLAATLGLTLSAGEGSQVLDLVQAPGRSGRSLYVAPYGSSRNDGSQSRPLDLATVLGPESPARPGDTVWLLGGHYRGHFVSDVAGTAEAPIVVRRQPGSRVTLDAASDSDQPTLLIRSPHVWYWGFEVTNSNPQRFQGRAGNPTMRGTGIDVRAAGIRIINVAVHDQANGIGAWSSAEGAEITGSLVYFNGIEGTDRGHGHGIYVQNTGPVKRIADNILFGGFGAGVHAYTENGNLDNLQFEGNVSFNNGALSAASEGMGYNILLGGMRLAWNPVLRDNVTYVASPRGGNTELGYRAGCRDAIVEGNYFVGGDPLNLTNCEGAVVRNNTLYGRASPALEAAFPENRFLLMRPLANEILVRPNRYERGRAHIVVFNWEGLDAVEVSAAGAHLRLGDRYEVRDAQNFYGPPVVTGRYSGRSIVLPMNRLTIAQPMGSVPLPPAHSGPAFAVFVLKRTDS